jgi:hypothetical protein
MNRRVMILSFVVILSCVFTFTWLLQSATVVYANLTAKLCDSNVKYWCSQVDYGPNGSGWQINGRRYWGGYGISTPGGTSGADKWQLWLLRDWHARNGTWQIAWQCSKPCDNWHANPRPGVEGPFTNGPTGTNAVRNYNASVQFQHRYFQTQPTTRTFCQGIEEHYLSNGTSYYREELINCN